MVVKVLKLPMVVFIAPLGVRSSLLVMPVSKTHGEAPVLVAMVDHLSRFVLSVIR